MSRNHKFHNPEGVYFVSFATVDYVDVFTFCHTMLSCGSRGNISYSTWTYLSPAVSKGYAYKYDEHNRLLDAIFQKGTSTQVANGFDENYTYDKMGNIKTLKRKKDNVLIDNLNLGYNGNQLGYVDDGQQNQNLSSVKEYRNVGNFYGEFTYDADGNLIKDLDREIHHIKYNLLNLPDTIQFNNGNQIINRYDADGQKLSTDYLTFMVPISVPLTEGKVNNWGFESSIMTVSGVAYVGNTEYSTSLGSGGRTYNYKQTNNEEGYTKNLTNVSYYYFRRDHLGSIREVVVSSGALIQSMQYYPSGLPWAESRISSWQQRKYNGKEWIEAHGLDEYDSQARMYYPAIMRTTTIDPLAEKYYSISPYAWCGNNPVNRVDPDGMDWFWDKDKTRQYDPNIHSQKDLGKGQTYIGVTDVVKDKDGNIFENYRKDGSIMFKHEKSAYSRILTNSNKTGNEEMGIITDKGVLVVPNYKNTPKEVDIKLYGYSYKDGNVIDNSGINYKTIATVHTHPDGSGPSTYDYDNYADLGLATYSTPYKPVYVLQLNNKNAVSLIVAAPNISGTSDGLTYRTFQITKNFPNANISNLINGRFSLIQYTKSNNFYDLLRLK